MLDGRSVYGLIPTVIHDPRTGRPYVNAAKHQQTPLFLGHRVEVAAGRSASFTLEAERDADASNHIEVRRLAARSTGPFAVSITDPLTKQRHTAGVVESSLIFGTGGRPAELRPPLFMRAGSHLEIRVVDLSNAPNTVELCAEVLEHAGAAEVLGVSLAHATALAKASCPYWVTHPDGPVVTVAGGAPHVFTFTVPQDADLEVLALRCRADGPLSLQLTSGIRPLMRTPVGAELVCAMTSPGIPAATLEGLAEPWVLRRGSKVRVALSSDTGADVRASFAFAGRLLKVPPAPSGATHVTFRRTLVPAAR